MRSHVFLAGATAFVGAAAMTSTVTVQPSSCNCTTAISTDTSPYSNSTALETLSTTTTSIKLVTAVVTSEAFETIYPNATASTSCDSAVTVYSTLTPVSVVTVSVFPQPLTSTSIEPSVVIPRPVNSSNFSKPCSTSSVNATGWPTGWSNPSYSTSMSTPTTSLNTATVSASTSIAAQTTVHHTPTPGVWDGSGRSLAPPRVFALLVKIIPFVVQARAQAVHKHMRRSLLNMPSNDDDTNANSAPLYSADSAVVPSDSGSLESSSVEPSTALTHAEVVTIISTAATLTKTVVMSDVTPVVAVDSLTSSESDVIVIVTAPCSNATTVFQTASNSTLTSTSVLYTNATTTQLTITTPALTPSAPSSSPPIMSMPAGGDAVVLETIPQWLVLDFIAMVMMF